MQNSSCRMKQSDITQTKKVYTEYKFYPNTGPDRPANQLQKK
jgi:hypothetical protein